MNEPMTSPGSWRDAFLHGIPLAIPAALFLLVIPSAVSTYVQLGVSDWELVIAASALPLSVLAVLVVTIPATRVPRALTMACFGSGAVAVAAGLSWFVDLSNHDATVAITLLSVAMTALFATSLLAFKMRRAAAPRVLGGGSLKEGLAHALGGVIVLVVAAPLLLLPRGHGIALVITGIATFLVPLASAEPVPASNESTNRIPRTHLLATMLDMLVATFFTVHASIATGWWMLAVAGAAAGFVISGTVSKHAIAAVLLKALLAAGIVAFVLLEPTPLRAAWTGLVPGLLLATLVAKAGQLPRGTKKASTGLVLLGFMGFTVLGGGLGTYGINIVADPGLLPPVIAVMIAILATSTLLDLSSWGRVAGAMQRAARHPWPARGKISKPLKIATVAAVVLAPVLSGIGIGNAGLAVTVHFPATMYDVHGNPVTSVVLGPSTAKILFTSPDPTATGHETIRPGKSVRLGGYYYGYGDNFSRADVIEWIASTNDVFSFGFMGHGDNMMTPANISAIKAANPGARFYYMAFATTLYETSEPIGHGPSWGNSHYPTVQFNDTLHDMTLKLANGSEARGVRRNPDRDDAHLMDLGNMAWADYFAWIYENRSIEFGADGVAIDEVMWQGYWNVDRWNGGVPLRDYQSLDEIVASCYAWLERIREGMSVEIITQAFWPSAMQYQDGVWGEIAFRAGGPYGGPVSDMNEVVWYEPMTWQGIVENARDIAGSGKSYIWAAWYEDGDLRGLEYAVATYLMAKPNGCTSLVFQPHPGHYYPDLVGYAVERVAQEVDTHAAYFDMELGNATGEMVLKQGSGGHYWQRDFDNGIVLVNPFQAKLFHA